MEHLKFRQIKAKVLLQQEMVPGGRAEPSKSACCYQLPHSFSVGRDLQLHRQPAKAESSTSPGSRHYPTALGMLVPQRFQPVATCTTKLSYYTPILPSLCVSVCVCEGACVPESVCLCLCVGVFVCTEA